MIAKEIICWQPVLTDYQAYTFAALGRAGSAAINVYSMARSDDIRALQGWSEAVITISNTVRATPITCPAPKHLFQYPLQVGLPLHEWPDPTLFR